MINIKSTSLPPAEKLKKKLAKALGFKLPPKFISFVNAPNGGIPESNEFDIPGRPGGSVVRFLGLTEEDDCILSWLEAYAERIPDRFIPIAELAGGDVLCVDENDRVFHWNHELEGNGAAVTFIASDIGEFINKMRPFDEASVVLRPEQVKKAWINPDFKKRL